MRVKSHFIQLNHCSSEVVSLRLWTDIADDHKSQQRDVSDHEDVFSCKSQKGESSLEDLNYHITLMELLNSVTKKN